LTVGIAVRIAARKAGNFTAADAIRVELAAAGVMLEDKPHGLLYCRLFMKVRKGIR